MTTHNMNYCMPRKKPERARFTFELHGAIPFKHLKPFENVRPALSEDRPQYEAARMKTDTHAARTPSDAQLAARSYLHIVKCFSRVASPASVAGMNVALQCFGSMSVHIRLLLLNFSFREDEDYGRSEQRRD